VVLRRNRLQQKDVAAALGLSCNAVWAWAAGRSVPTGRNLVRLLEYLKQFEPTLTAEDLVGPAAAGSEC
jgi:transcriptional regulator with XRE-family HTH domain